MSIKCMVYVFWNSESSGNDRLVLLAIADEADDEGRDAFPSIRRIATKANCHKDTVIDCVKRLEAMGELQVVRPEKQGRGRFNKYKVIMPKEKVGNSDHFDSGLVEGSVEGLVRTQPTQNHSLSDPKRGEVRPFMSYPQDSYPQKSHCPNPECENGWVFTDGNVVEECKECRKG